MVVAKRNHCEIIAVGSEMLTPWRTETNSLFISEKLNDLGAEVVRKVVVGDDSSEIREALERACRKVDIVIFCGGLGPTNDDITREVVAEALGRSLILDKDILDDLRRRFRKHGFRFTENNHRQAMVPRGATVIRNAHGTAPGLFLKERHALIFLLPGPPRELQPMMARQVVPLVEEHLPTYRPDFRRLKVAGEGESAVDSRIEKLYQACPRIQTTILSSLGIIEILLHWRGEPEADSAGDELDGLAGKIRAELGASVFTDQEEGLEEVVGRLLHSKNLTLATAESCTGGLIGKMISDVPGSSDYYRGGVVCYSNESKVSLCNVNETTLERFGAVSSQVACQMAQGIRDQTEADISLSVTGIAGPSGSTPAKPIGLVYLGLSVGPDTQAREYRFPGNRKSIRLRSARFSLDWLRRSLL